MHYPKQYFMKHPWLFIVFFAAAITGGCTSSGSRNAAIAEDMCGCFNRLKDSLPPEGMRVFEKTAASATPQETFEGEMKALPAEAAEKLKAALLLTAKPGSAINNCIKDLDKKHKTTVTSQQDMTQKMIDAVSGKTGCEIMLALLRMNVKK